jgi:hypothetical protein
LEAIKATQSEPLPLSEAEPRDAVEQYKLGQAYYYGNGVTQNYVEAVKWWRKAAEQSFSPAQYELGCFEEDNVEAVKWWRKAAEQGFSQARYELGCAYCNGEGVPQDYVKAYMWFSLAWESKSERNFGVMILPNPSADEQRERIQKFMTLEQVADAERLVREWEESRAS